MTRYLDIERVRFSDRLLVEWDVDAKTRDAAVPSLVPQSLVENARVHGIGMLKGPGRVVVGADTHGAMLL